MINLVLEQKTENGVEEKDLADELHKLMKRKFPRRRVISIVIDQIWAADLVEMQKFSKWIKR